MPDGTLAAVAGAKQQLDCIGLAAERIRDDFVTDRKCNRCAPRLVDNVDALAEVDVGRFVDLHWTCHHQMACVRLVCARRASVRCLRKLTFWPESGIPGG